MFSRLFLSIALFFPALAQQNPDWVKPFPPFKILGNIHWVGTWDLSTYLITTPQGHILINTGLAETVPQIKANVEKLGFRLSDVKILTATHAHSDHVAGMAELKKMTGAKMVMSEQDSELLENGGKTDFRWGDMVHTLFPPVKVDQKLKASQKISLGGTELTLHIHPGHTKGATSFTLDVREGGKTYRVVIANMASVNPGVNLKGMARYPVIAQEYARTFQDQKQMKIDVWLASHAEQFKLHEKYQPGATYNPERFVDPVGFHSEVKRLGKIYVDQLAIDRKAQ